MAELLIRFIKNDITKNNGGCNMSKKLTGVITAVLIVGAMRTTFAASNPFSDVPTGHWSYGAVAKLA